MNIFFLDKNPQLAAQYLCDKHVVKMTLETAQLLSTAKRLVDKRVDLWIKDEYPVYRSTHTNHPCSIWARSSRQNYCWLGDYGLALCAEYTLRYNRIHAAQKIIEFCRYNPPDLPGFGFTFPALCMPEKYKKEDFVQAYRDYYIGEKLSFAKWRTGIPEWIKPYLREKVSV